MQCRLLILLFKLLTLISMQLKTFLTINGIIGIITGVFFLLFPQNALSFSGIATDESAILITRLLGAEFIGLNLLTWLLRNSDNSGALKNLLVARCVSENGGFIILFSAILSGNDGAGLWMLAASYLAFGLGYIYSWQRKVDGLL